MAPPRLHRHPNVAKPALRTARGSSPPASPHPRDRRDRSRDNPRRRPCTRYTADLWPRCRQHIRVPSSSVPSPARIACGRSPFRTKHSSPSVPAPLKWPFFRSPTVARRRLVLLAPTRRSVRGSIVPVGSRHMLCEGRPKPGRKLPKSRRVRPASLVASPRSPRAGAGTSRPAVASRRLRSCLPPRLRGWWW